MFSLSDPLNNSLSPNSAYVYLIIAVWSHKQPRINHMKSSAAVKIVKLATVIIA